MRGVLTKRHSEADMELSPAKRRFVWVARVLKPDGSKGRGITLSKMPRPDQRDRHGRRRLSTMGRAMAEQKMARVLAEMEKEVDAEYVEYDDDDGAMHLLGFDRFVEEYGRRTKGTIATKSVKAHMEALRSLRRFCSPKTPRAVNGTVAKRFVQAARGAGLAEATVNKHLGSLRRVWNDTPGLMVNPFRSGRKGGIRRFKVAEKDWHLYEPEEITKVLTACPDDRWRGMILTAYGAGLRLGEIQHLTWDDVDFSAAEIHVNPKRGTGKLVAWVPKDKDRRRLPMAPELAGILTRSFLKRDGENPYLFLGTRRWRHILAKREAGKWSEDSDMMNNFLRDYHQILSRAGLPVGEFHSLRKSCITNWLDAGVAPHVVQKMAGHASIETTIKHYSKMRRTAPDSVREASKRFAPKLAG